MWNFGKKHIFSRKLYWKEYLFYLLLFSSLFFTIIIIIYYYYFKQCTKILSDLISWPHYTLQKVAKGTNIFMNVQL